MNSPLNVWRVQEVVVTEGIIQTALFTIKKKKKYET